MELLFFILAIACIAGFVANAKGDTSRKSERNQLPDFKHTPPPPPPPKPKNNR